MSTPTLNQWPKQNLDPQRARALRWATQALSEATVRSTVDRTQGRKSWTAGVEAVWWALALDESYELLLPPKLGYQDTRNADADGSVVAGMRWLRNRHAHDLSVTGFGGPKRPFLSGPGDPYVLFISSTNRWLPSNQVLVGQDRSPKLRPLYDQNVGGKPISQTLQSATQWFTRVLAATGIPAQDGPTVDPTIL